MATLDISGKTKVLACLADPVGHIRAPTVFNAEFEKRGIDAVLIPIHVTPDGLAACVEGLRAIRNVVGFTVTVPHKVAAVDLCDSVGPQGRAMGAINWLRFDEDRALHGENFDGRGFVEGMRVGGFPVEGETVLQVGAGGAGRAIAFALAEAGVSRLVIANRTEAKARDLAAAVSQAFPGVSVTAGAPDPGGFGIVVNTSSMGLHDGDPLPVDPSLLSRDQLVAEIIMQPVETAILRAAKARGCRVHLGHHMLDAQIDLAGRFVGAW